MWDLQLAVSVVQLVVESGGQSVTGSAEWSEQVTATRSERYT